jgi:Uma2 family endonuclease
MVALQDYYEMTAEEYLVWEEKQPLKYEYFEGKIVAMTGGSVAHGTIAANIFYALKSHLRGKGCRPFVFDVKLGISEKGPFHYPDVMVTCDPRDQQALKIIHHPCLIIEVLSPGTESFDRGKKFQNYRNLSSLKEYILVSTEQKIFECFRLNERGIWEFYTYTEGEKVELKSIDFSCDFEQIYEDVILSEMPE